MEKAWKSQFGVIKSLQIPTALVEKWRSSQLSPERAACRSNCRWSSSAISLHWCLAELPTPWNVAKSAGMRILNGYGSCNKLLVALFTPTAFNCIVHYCNSWKLQQRKTIRSFADVFNVNPWLLTYPQNCHKSKWLFKTSNSPLS
jgi:hypothetical protein